MNYKDMYYALFNEITDIIKQLQDLQIKAESMYIDQSINNQTLFVKKENKK